MEVLSCLSCGGASLTNLRHGFRKGRCAPHEQARHVHPRISAHSRSRARYRRHAHQGPQRARGADQAVIWRGYRCTPGVAGCVRRPLFSPGPRGRSAQEIDSKTTNVRPPAFIVDCTWCLIGRVQVVTGVLAALPAEAVEMPVGKEPLTTLVGVLGRLRTRQRPRRRAHAARQRASSPP